MGYHTELKGHFELDKPLSKLDIRKFKFVCKTYHEKDEATFTRGMSFETYDESCGCRVDDEEKGDYEYSSGEEEDAAEGSTVFHYVVPNERCKWGYNKQRCCIEQDGEKPYNYVDWIKVICAFMNDHGYKLNGRVFWAGDDDDDVGAITVDDNEVRTSNEPSTEVDRSNRNIIIHVYP